MARRRKSKAGKWLVTGALVAALAGGGWWWVASSNRPAPSAAKSGTPATARASTPKAPVQVEETRRTASPARPLAPAAMPIDRVRKTTVPRPALPVGG